MSVNDLDVGEFMDHDGLRRILAREAIQSGRLPTGRAARIWGGPGAGSSCTVCGLPISAGELGYELEFAENGESCASHHLHVPCFAAWESESGNSGKRPNDEATFTNGRPGGNGHAR
jgi:hypothetical protein